MHKSIAFEVKHLCNIRWIQSVCMWMLLACVLKAKLKFLSEVDITRK